MVKQYGGHLFTAPYASLKTFTREFHKDFAPCRGAQGCAAKLVPVVVRRPTSILFLPVLFLYLLPNELLQSLGRRYCLSYNTLSHEYNPLPSALYQLANSLSI